MERKGPFICFEGIDGSGKGTQAGLMVQALSQRGLTVASFAFPRYKTPMGRAIAACLRGAHGNFVEWSPRLAAPPFALDRFEARGEMLEALRSGMAICDRYVHSNVAHQAAKLQGGERVEMIEWIEKLELKTLALPKPDLVIWLDMPVTQAVALVEKKADRDHLVGLKRDQHESAISYQQEVAAVYRQLAERSGWLTVRCSPTSTPRMPGQIHDEIMEKLKSRLPELFRTAA